MTDKKFNLLFNDQANKQKNAFIQNYLLNWAFWDCSNKDPKNVAFVGTWLLAHFPIFKSRNLRNVKEHFTGLKRYKYNYFKNFIERQLKKRIEVDKNEWISSNVCSIWKSRQTQLKDWEILWRKSMEIIYWETEK